MPIKSACKYFFFKPLQNQSVKKESINRLKMGLLVIMVRILWSTLYTVTNVSVIVVNRWLLCIMKKPLLVLFLHTLLMRVRKLSSGYILLTQYTL